MKESTPTVAKKKTACTSYHNPLHTETQGRIKGGGHFGQVPGAPRFRGAPCADFLGLLVVYDPMFFGTALHNFGRTYHICIAGRWGTAF